MVSRSQLNAQIDSVFNDNIPDQSLKPSAEGTQLKSMLDYVDQFAVYTSGSVTLSTTPMQLPYDINFLSFGGGIAYLPTTSQINKTILVLCNQNAIVRANSSNSNGLFITYGTPVASISLLANDICRFTYIGNNYWLAEKIINT